MTQPLPKDDLDFILARTREPWEEMRGERLFLTGGTGFFGCWLLESLLHANREAGLAVQVTVLSRNPEAFQLFRPHLTRDPAITLLRGDVQDFNFPDGRFKYVIHAATETYARSGSGGAVEMLRTIVGGTERVLQFASIHGTEKFLLTSSGAIYGPQPAELTHIGEDYRGAPDPLRPESAYGEGKRAAEALCVAYGQHYGFACKIARCFSFVGPLLPLDQHFAIGNFIRNVLAGQPIKINGDGTPRRSYMYASDLARWLWTLLLNAPGGEAFNVGSDHVIRIQDLACTVVAVSGSTRPVSVARPAAQGAAIAQYVPCTRKAEQELGLICEISLEEAIRRTIEWHGSVRD